ncbi:MAG: hypothetical protein IJV35_01180 [Neisseriaceae bacterium]|nr:hypothetical protein [Neisseriaceae bacterium]
MPRFCYAKSRNDTGRKNLSGSLKPKFNPVCHCEPCGKHGVAIQNKRR